MIQTRTGIKNLAPYVLPNTSAPSGMRQIQLAQNESAFGPSPAVIEAAQQAAANMAAYPDPNFTAVRESIAAVHQLDVNQILCGSGSLGLISLLANTYLEAGVSVVASEYSYLYFRTAAKIAGATILTAPEPDLEISVDAMLAAVRPDTRIVFVANPGNPSGSFIQREELVRLRDRLPADVLLIIDEAYAEYVDPNQYARLFDLVERGNTVILRTFSKIYGLAGMRVGWGYFPPEMLDMLRRIQIPNNVSAVAQAVAAAAMRDQNYMAHVRDTTADIRQQMIHTCQTLGMRPRPSHCNFVLCQLPSPQAADRLDDYLRANGIIVRVMRGYSMPEFVRITLGTADQMEEVAAALHEYYNQM